MKKVLVINDPSINILEIRDPEIYGNNSIGNVKK
jgi:3-dehydroquinate dehydratase